MVRLSRGKQGVLKNTPPACFGGKVAIMAQYGVISLQPLFGKVSFINELKGTEKCRTINAPKAECHINARIILCFVVSKKQY